MAGLNRRGHLLADSQVNGSTIKKIAVGVAIVVFAGLILAGIRSCRWTHDAIIKLEEKAKK